MLLNIDTLYAFRQCISHGQRLYFASGGDLMNKMVERGSKVNYKINKYFDTVTTTVLVFTVQTDVSGNSNTID